MVISIIKLSLLNYKVKKDGDFVASYVYRKDSLVPITVSLEELSKLIDIKVPVKLIPEEKSSYEDAVEKTHIHNNKDIIDKISYDEESQKVLYDNVEITKDMLTKPQIEKLIFDHNNGFGTITYEDKEKYDNTVELSHSHNNQSILDGFSYDATTSRLMYENIPLEGAGLNQSEVSNLIDEKVPIKVTEYEKEQYDECLSKAHQHTNSLVLNSLSDNNGSLYYNGISVNKGLSEDEIIILIDDKVPAKITLLEKGSYDNAVMKAHEHTNNDVLEMFTYEDGVLKFNGKTIKFEE